METGFNVNSIYYANAEAHHQKNSRACRCLESIGFAGIE